MHAELPVDQPPAVAFTAFVDVWPRATGNEDRRLPVGHGCGRIIEFLTFTLQICNLQIVTCFLRFILGDM